MIVTAPIGVDREEARDRALTELLDPRYEREPLFDRIRRYIDQLIGDLTDVGPSTVEQLYAADFDHLQRLYERLNTDGEKVGSITCPECSHAFEVDLSEIEDERLGE